MEPANAQALAQAIDRLLGDPKLQETMGRQADAGPGFTLDHMVDETEALYREMVDAARRRVR